MQEYWILQIKYFCFPNNKLTPLLLYLPLHPNSVLYATYSATTSKGISTETSLCSLTIAL